MEIESLFGLPAHPLLVHGAVVLVPLASLGALACLRPQWRRRYGVVVVILALGALVAVGLSQGSGEELEGEVDETELVEDHASMGDTFLPVSALLLVTVGGLVGLDVWQRRRETGGGDGSDPSWVRPVHLVLAGLMALTAIGGTARIIQIGHSGAEATWSDLDEEGDGGEDRADEEDEDEDEEDDD